MSTHLSHKQLNGKAIEVLAELEALLAEVKFRLERNDLEKCEDHPDFHKIMIRLIKELDFVLVKDPVPENMAYMAFRIPVTVAESVNVRVSASSGPVYLVPLHISKNRPMVSCKPFTPGTATLVKIPVEVSQGFEFLVIAAPNNSTSLNVTKEVGV